VISHSIFHTIQPWFSIGSDRSETGIPSCPNIPQGQALVYARFLVHFKPHLEIFPKVWVILKRVISLRRRNIDKHDLNSLISTISNIYTYIYIYIYIYVLYIYIYILYPNWSPNWFSKHHFPCSSHQLVGTRCVRSRYLHEFQVAVTTDLSMKTFSASRGENGGETQRGRFINGARHGTALLSSNFS